MYTSINRTRHPGQVSADLRFPHTKLQRPFGGEKEPQPRFAARMKLPFAPEPQRSRRVPLHIACASLFLCAFPAALGGIYRLCSTICHGICSRRGSFSPLSTRHRTPRLLRRSRYSSLRPPICSASGCGSSSSTNRQLTFRRTSFVNSFPDPHVHDLAGP